MGTTPPPSPSDKMDHVALNARIIQLSNEVDRLKKLLSKTESKREPFYTSYIIMLCMHSETCLCCVSCINKLFTSLFVSNVATWSTVCLCVTVVFLSPLYALSIEDYVMSIMVFIHNYVL